MSSKDKGSELPSQKHGLREYGLYKRKFLQPEREESTYKLFVLC
jgi:hypothetical protein